MKNKCVLLRNKIEVIWVSEKRGGGGDENHVITLSTPYGYFYYTILDFSLITCDFGIYMFGLLRYQLNESPLVKCISNYS